MFREIVQAIADDIAEGRLEVGARLPPHRDLADHLGVARGTVARAYTEAAKLGLVESVVGRGTRVLAADGSDRRYASLLEAPTVLGDLSMNLPLSGIDPDPGDVLRRLAERPDRRSLLRYHPPGGIGRHRMAGVEWLARLGVTATVDDVLLAAGAQHALFVLFAHLAPRGSALYVEELTYPGLHGIAETLSLELVPVAMDAEGMDPDDLARIARKRGKGTVYLMPTIHNPVGGVMSAARRSAIAEVMRTRDLYLVEDAANHMLAKRTPPPLAMFAPERSFLVASVSKVLAPGLRIAFVTGPTSELPAISRRVWATQWMVGPIGAEMVAMWLEEGVVDRTVKKKRREALRRQTIVEQIFGKRRVTAHPDALHAWIALSRPWHPQRHEIVVTPASAFWARTTPAPNAVRIALGGIEKVAALERALALLANTLH